MRELTLTLLKQLKEKREDCGSLVDTLIMLSAKYELLIDLDTCEVVDWGTLK